MYRQSWWEVLSNKIVKKHNEDEFVIIITGARLQQAAGKLDTVNCVKFLHIYRALGHLSQ